ncbi:ATP dependent DNA ligase domain-containing protein [Mesorhizobium albiziae]|uniref:DNA ligase (ATP) n=1 Tax=Neomesorhizobium albiziae TaxID=335020 RepID=A0A1I4ERC0_9HYPH|nr:hypothetical protein GCM10007937_24650 [Mesorhizobium albiziae]SFL07763.1 ATP dependent DNA ligase domain-containing protein [Mesorhizobium albiziae]
MFVVFDLTMLNGEDLRDRPLAERRERLFDLLSTPHPEGIVFSEAIEGNPGDLLEQACAFGLEGVVSKLLDSPYRSGRVKAKCIKSDEFVVIGYEPGGSYGGLGSLLLATAEDGKLAYIGGVGTGFNSESALPLKAKLDAIQTGSSPIPGLKNKNAVWTRPAIIVEVKFRGWTEDDQLRHPSFKRVREDRSPSPARPLRRYRSTHLRTVRGQTPAACATACGVCPLSICLTIRSRPCRVSRAFL